MEKVELSSKAFQMLECKNSTILDCTFNGSEQSGYLSISHSQDILVEKNSMSNYSISLSECNESRFEDNEIRNGYGFGGWGSSTIGVFRNRIVNNTVGIGFSDSTNLTISSNLLEGNQEGMRFWSSNGNHIYLNNFVKNDQQLGIYDSFANSFDNGYEGNYWSDYNGTDTNNDGIGETNIPHQKVDWLPIMGSTNQIDLTLDGSPYEVDIASNSTVSNFQYGGDRINFEVSGQDGTTGFCRICIPIALLNGTYRVFVNGIEVQYNPLPCSNSTHSYLYFNYTHSTEEVTIIPEFPSFLILPLFMMAMLLAVIVYRRRMEGADG
jgi:parallel beta-helix repeat protein